VISKVLLILEALQGFSTGLGLKGYLRSRRHSQEYGASLSEHLERERYLIRTEAGAYLIGPRLAQMSARSHQGATLHAVARRILWELWKSTQGTVNLAVLDQGTVLYADLMESRTNSGSHRTLVLAVPCTSQR
jgi:DNA-binding IclR family transcriptional regulator